MAIRVGIGGWNFPEWKGVFYPEGLPAAKELAYASSKLTSIEINATFYRTQSAASFRKWSDETPDGFVFSVKGHRAATQSRDPAIQKNAIERFIGSGILELGDKLGPLMWQFAPYTKFEENELGNWLGWLPDEAEGRRLRHVLEVRSKSFADPRFIALLRAKGAAVAMVDSDKHPPIQDVTADFLYARLERSQEDEPTGYPPAALDAWAKRFRAWEAGGEPDDAIRINEAKPKKVKRDCFVYVISGAKVRAPAGAMALIERLK